MSKRSRSSLAVWALIACILWVLAWIIAEAIPVFNDLLGLVSALFASWFTYGLGGVFWLWMNWGGLRGRRMWVLAAVNGGLVLMGAVIVRILRFSFYLPPPPASYITWFLFALHTFGMGCRGGVVVDYRESVLTNRL